MALPSMLQTRVNNSLRPVPHHQQISDAKTHPISLCSAYNMLQLGCTCWQGHDAAARSPHLLSSMDILIQDEQVLVQGHIRVHHSVKAAVVLLPKKGVHALGHLKGSRVAAC